MEVWINNKEIIDRICCRIENLSDNARVEYLKSDLPETFNMVRTGSKDLTHEFVIAFCILTNTSYKYIVLGISPIYDVVGKNNMYKHLIDKRDYSID